MTEKRRSDAIVAAPTETNGAWNTSLTVFLRVVALGYVALTLRDWALALGLTDETFRYDSAGTAWTVYLTIVCVLHPIVAIGLWTTLAWGRVVWLMSIAVQMVTMTIYRDVFGVDWVFAAIILATLVAYAVLALAVRFKAKEA